MSPIAPPRPNLPTHTNRPKMTTHNWFWWMVLLVAQILIISSRHHLATAVLALNNHLGANVLFGFVSIAIMSAALVGLQVITKPQTPTRVKIFFAINQWLFLNLAYIVGVATFK